MHQLMHICISCADLKSIIELAQNEEVESIVLKRYGREAYRIFRLLSKAGHLVETDKISNTTFVAKKDTAKILYQLWKDDYLHMEKIVTYGSKQSQFLLWNVNKHTLWDNVLNEMYHTALNLRIRIAHEQEQEKEVRKMQTATRTLNPFTLTLLYLYFDLILVFIVTCSLSFYFVKSGIFNCLQLKRVIKLKG
ncbi:uncharacterized protein LOC114289764 [Camellia sinensis]|uniref:uncharacterized protein LOC114289764 n=1 Tax=Camellia sinensis TaxID=4442 RepID=UPI00103664E8|nr:uncharacterized protein LOC114289764 [Camellia sinensis]